jgi:hypothetical protein
MFRLIFSSFKEIREEQWSMNGIVFDRRNLKKSQLTGSRQTRSLMTKMRMENVQYKQDERVRFLNVIF